MRKAWTIGCVLALATAGLGCEPAPEADTSPPPPPGESLPATEERWVFEGTDDDDPEAVAEEEPAPEAAVPELDPRVTRPMELGGDDDAPTTGELWPRPQIVQRGAFIVREGTSYYVGGPPPDPAAEPTEAEVRAAEAEALVAEAEARIVDAEARALEAEARAAEAEALALEAELRLIEADAQQRTTRVFRTTVVPVPSLAALETITRSAEAAAGDTSTSEPTDPIAPPGYGQQGLPVEPGIGQQGLPVEPGYGQQGLSLEPGAGQGGVGQPAGGGP